MKSSEILKAALKKIQKGWIQNRCHNDDNSKFCAIGALMAVKPGAWETVCPLLVSVSRIVPDRKEPVSAILRWNDAPKRTKAQVVNLFKKAIALALKEEAKSK